jgi:hypothetical protein
MTSGSPTVLELATIADTMVCPSGDVSVVQPSVIVASCSAQSWQRKVRPAVRPYP